MIFICGDFYFLHIVLSSSIWGIYKKERWWTISHSSSPNILTNQIIMKITRNSIQAFITCFYTILYVNPPQNVTNYMKKIYTDYQSLTTSWNVFYFYQQVRGQFNIFFPHCTDQYYIFFPHCTNHNFPLI